MLYRGDDEDFLGVQLVGAVPEHFAVAAKKLNEYDFSLVDVNLGCPVPKVAKKCAGAELGLHPEEAARCFETVARHSRFPVSAKLRILDAEDPEPTLRLCRLLVENGARALTVHGRVKQAFYSGPVHFGIIRAVREAFPEIEVIANGGVRSRSSYEEIRRRTGWSRVMVATGSMGNPWIFRELTGPAGFRGPSAGEWRRVIEEQSSGMIRLYGEENACRRARKIFHDYLKGRGFPGSLRAVASQTSSAADLAAWLDTAVNSGVLPDE